MKASFGWETAYVLAGGPEPRTGAQILFHHLPLGFTLAYIPKGPVGICEDPSAIPDWERLMPEVDAACRKKRAIFLKIEPDIWEPTVQVGSVRKTRTIPPPQGFRTSPHTIQPPRTLIVDLRGDEDQVLGRMKQKTRYNIRLAQKKGVVVHSTADLDTFHRLMSITAQRDSFGVHSLPYYRRVYEIFYPRGACELLMAEFQGEPLSGLMIFTHGKRAWFLFGGSASVHRDRMPNYLIQWEAMRWARAHGCVEYDLWGTPDDDEDVLETQFTTREDGLWGVYRNKRGYGGELMRAAGPWDRVYRPTLYAFYLWWVKRRGVAD